MQGWMRLFVLAVAAASPAEAHHTLTGYDMSRPVTLEGVVSEFQFGHPHPVLVIEVGAGSASQTWRLEMDNLFELRAVGLSRDSFKVGDRVRISGSPSRDGDRQIYLRRLDRQSDGLHYEQVGRSPAVSFRSRP